MSERSARAGRIVFGASTIVYGVVTLLWHDSDMWQRVRPHGEPFASVSAWIVAIALVTGGAALLRPRTAGMASVVLGVGYGLFTLACTADIAAAPFTPGSYVDFFEQLSIVCGALAVFAATHADADRAAMLASAARVALGICMLAFAWAQIAYFTYTASLVPAWIPPGRIFWTTLTTVAFVLAGIATALDRQALLAMRLAAAMLALFGLLVWLPQVVTHAATLSNWSEFALNDAIAAACWLVAGVHRRASDSGDVTAIAIG